MKKIALSFALLVFSLVSFGQYNVVPPPTMENSQLSGVGANYSYCELIVQPRPFSTKVNIILDFGQETRFFQDRRLRDEETGNVKKFNSIIDALNYMASQGWEFIQAYNALGMNNNPNMVEMHYIMRKRN